MKYSNQNKDFSFTSLAKGTKKNFFCNYKIYFQSKTDIYMNVKVVPAMINDIEIKMRTMLKNKSTLAKTCSCWIFGAKAKSAEKARRRNMTMIPMSEMIPVLKTQYPDSQCSTESRQLVQECHRLVQFSILTKVLVLSINSEWLFPA